MKMGLYGKLFDRNKDGKLGFYEEMHRQLWFEHEKRQRDQRIKEENNRKSQTISARGSTRTRSQKENLCGNTFNLDPEYLPYVVEDVKISPSILEDTKSASEELQGNMKISASRKKIFLQETFELLRDEYVPNADAIKDIIGKMAKIDCVCAVEMWKYLIENYPEILHSYYDFGYIIMNTIEQVVGNEKVYRLVTEDTFLKNAIFSELGDMQYTPIQTIRFYVFSGKTELANDLLILSYNNKYRRTSFYQILEGVVEYHPDETMTTEAFELLMKWIEKVSNKQERAKLNLAMLNYMEEE